MPALAHRELDAGGAGVAAVDGIVDEVAAEKLPVHAEEADLPPAVVTVGILHGARRGLAALQALGAAVALVPILEVVTTALAVVGLRVGVVVAARESVHPRPR